MGGTRGAHGQSHYAYNKRLWDRTFGHIRSTAEAEAIAIGEVSTAPAFCSVRVRHPESRSGTSCPGEALPGGRHPGAGAVGQVSVGHLQDRSIVHRIHTHSPSPIFFSASYQNPRSHVRRHLQGEPLPGQGPLHHRRCVVLARASRCSTRRPPADASQAALALATRSPRT